MGQDGAADHDRAVAARDPALPGLRSGSADDTDQTGGPELVCTVCGLAYRIDDGVPVLLVDEARRRPDRHPAREAHDAWVDEHLLDDPGRCAPSIPRDSLRSLATAGAQVRTSLTATREADLRRLTAEGRPRAVVVASLGGSSVVGDVLDLLAGAVRRCR